VCVCVRPFSCSCFFVLGPLCANFFTCGTSLGRFLAFWGARNLQSEWCTQKGFCTPRVQNRINSHKGAEVEVVSRGPRLEEIYTKACHRSHLRREGRAHTHTHTHTLTFNALTHSQQEAAQRGTRTGYKIKKPKSRYRLVLNPSLHTP